MEANVADGRRGREGGMEGGRREREKEGNFKIEFSHSSSSFSQTRHLLERGHCISGNRATLFPLLLFLCLSLSVEKMAVQIMTLFFSILRPLLSKSACFVL